MSMKKIRWGIAGPGVIANKFAAAIKNVKEAELVAVASRSEERGREFAERYDIPNVFGTYEQMAKSDLVDAVYVSTPHPFHKTCGELFLGAKKHVLCEKPLCVNADEAQRLAKCSRENGVFLMEAMWTRFLPAIIEAKRIADSGKIGEIRGLSADFCYNIEPCEDPKVFKNEMAGGSLLDVGVYCLHLATMLFGGNPEKITALAFVKDGVDIHTNVLLKYKGGALANISSAIGLKKPETAVIYGTKGCITIPCFCGANELFAETENETEHIVKKSIGDGFEEQIKEACECISGGKTESDILPLCESISVLGQMDEIRKIIGIKYPYDV